jgi:CRISP-associated protein Cas1
MRRIIDLSGGTPDGPQVFRLRLDKDCLLISHGTEEYPEEARIPAHEVAVLVLGHRLALTGAVLGAVTANGGAVLALDDRFRPTGLMLPIEGNTQHAGRLRRQIERFPSLGPKHWRQIVQAKIRAQGALVPEEPRVLALANIVELGDVTNIEAQAARLYWSALFGDDFKRHGDSLTNMALNYGYAVIRGVVARAVCAAGFHPALGLHHHNERNTFALADDLMEPARPVVDHIVAGLDLKVFDRAAKKAVLGAATAKVTIDSKLVGLMEAYEVVCSSLVASLEAAGELLLPA